jgi:glycosyltransferase involved in cell wall biosynthesis
MNLAHNPRVTVFIPVYNRARLVGAAIESVLRQDFTDFELLLIDDGSTDDSVAVISSYRDPRIRLLRNDRNRGISATRQRGLEEARGTYLAVLDSDDRATPRRLEREVAFLDSHPAVATVGGWASEFDEAGRASRTVKLLPLVSSELEARLLFRTCHHHSATMSRLSVLREFGYDPAFPLVEDYDLFSRIAARHRLANLPHVLVHRRLHAGRITRERAAEVRRLNIVVAGRRLAALGLPSDEATVSRHIGLARLKKEKITPDRAMLAEAEAWFARILQANRDKGLYDQRALAATLGQLWAIACFHARQEIGVPTLSRFLRSPLAHSLPGSFAANLGAALGRRG